MLTFLEREDLFSTYSRPDGTLVYLAHGHPRRYLIDFHEVHTDWLVTRWQERNRSTSWMPDHQSRQDFLGYLRDTLTDPDIADLVRWCVQCMAVALEEDGSDVEHDGWACERCMDRYYNWCDECDQNCVEVSEMLNGRDVCAGCRDSRYSWCGECDGYYPDGDADEHNHDRHCNCEPFALAFSVRNDGEPPLASDTRATVSLPAGIISTEGLNTIRLYLCEQARTLYYQRTEDPDADAVANGTGEKLYNLANTIDTLGDKWQTKDGNYAKRLSRHAYKTHSLKVTPAILSQVGCIAADHSKSVDFEIETTRDLNLSPEEFGNEDSCWWGGYESSRCALKSNGGFGLRTFTEGDYYGDSVSGRAWVMPLRDDGSLAPTFNTETPDAFVVFNGYGDLGGYNAARIVSHMAGMTYRKITFTCDPMFINGNTGYLVAPEELADNYTDGALSLYVDRHSTLFTRETTEEYADAA